MELHKSNFSDREEQLKLYQQKVLTELQKIQPKWAYGKEADSLLDFSQHPINESYSIFLVDTSELIQKTEFIGFDAQVLFTGDLASDSRIATTLSQWENNGFVDPPTIILSDLTRDRLSIADGRHRTKLTYHLGHKEIPIAIQNNLIERVSQIINLTPI